MALFNWDEKKYSVGVKEMDQHHQQLMDIINRIEQASQTPVDRDRNFRLMNELVNYTLFHFAAEEKLMEQAKYPEIALHKVIHKDLITKVTQHKADFEKGGGVFSAQLMEFLQMWLNGHIMGVDTRYAKHIHPK